MEALCPFGNRVINGRYIEIDTARAYRDDDTGYSCEICAISRCTAIGKIHRHWTISYGVSQANSVRACSTFIDGGITADADRGAVEGVADAGAGCCTIGDQVLEVAAGAADRKSTRLTSSH